MKKRKLEYKDNLVMKNYSLDRLTALILKHQITFVVFWVTFSVIVFPGLRLSNASVIKPSLTINQALSLALDTHPLISSKQMELKAAKNEVSAARWSLFPNASYSFRGLEENDDADVLNQEVLTISQPIWTGGKISGNVELAKAKQKIAELNILEAEQILILETVRAFVELDRANSKLNISRSNVEEHERLFKIINRKVKASTSPKVDAKLAKARLALSRSQMVQNKNGLEIATANLEQLIGQPVFQIEPPILPPKKRFSSQEVVAAALRFSPAIRKLLEEITVLEASEKVINSALFPQLSIGYEKKYGKLLPNQDDEQVFLGLDFQPGAGLSSRLASNATSERKNAVNEALLAMEREVTRDVKIAWREYSAAKMQVSPANVLVASTTEVMDSYLRQYTVGRKSWLDVMNAQRELLHARQALVDHQAVLNLASFKIEILTGEINRQKVMSKSE